jgi:hypothetical protein
MLRPYNCTVPVSAAGPVKAISDIPVVQIAVDDARHVLAALHTLHAEVQ